jgi:hypothetical protein
MLGVHHGGLLRMHRKHVVLIDWIDDDVEDADEITVFADSTEEAIRKARTKWRMTVGVKWPQCRIVEAKVLPRRAAHQFA